MGQMALSLGFEVIVCDPREEHRASLRMDGSGYPRALLGADITPMGRILLLAEVVAAFYEKYDDMPAQRPRRRVGRPVCRGS